MNQNNYNNKGMFNTEFLQKSLEDCRKSIEQNAPNIQLLQKPLFIVSELASKENYMVQIDSTFSKPQYDLANFIKFNV